MKPSAGRTAAFVLLTLGLLYGILEGLSWGTLAVLGHKGHRYEPTPVHGLTPHQRNTLEGLLDGQKGHTQYDPELGWDLAPGAYWRRYRVNSQGARGEREFDSRPAPGILRIATFGDSFSFGDDVQDIYTYQEVLMRSDPDLEVINYGVSGYSPDQAFLRYQRMGTDLAPHIVLIGMMTENINRVVNVFRPFYMTRTGLPLTKPRFLPDGADGLRLAANPLNQLEDYRKLLDKTPTTLARLGTHDHYYQSKVRPGRLDFLPSVRLLKLTRQLHLQPDPIHVDGQYNTQNEAYEVTRRIMDHFYRAVEADGAVPILLHFCTKGDLYNREGGKKKIYQPILDHYERQGYRYIDLMDAFTDIETPIAKLASPHYSAWGHYHAAQHILKYLRENDLLRPPGAAAPEPSLASLLEKRERRRREFIESAAYQEMSNAVQESLLSMLEEGFERKLEEAARREGVPVPVPASAQPSQTADANP